MLDQLVAQLAAAAVAHHDGRIVGQRQRAAPVGEVWAAINWRLSVIVTSPQLQLQLRSECRSCTALIPRTRQLFRRQKPPVVVIRSACAFARNHRCAQRMPRRALLAKGRALSRLDRAAQHVSGVAQRRLLGVNAGDLEALLGVEFAIIGIQPPAAAWESRRCRARRDPSPQKLRPAAFAPHDCLRRSRRARRRSRLRARPASSWITVRRIPSSRSSGSNPVTTIGIVELLGQRRILPVAHHAAHMAGGQKCLHLVSGRTHESPQSPAAPARAKPAPKNSSARAAWPGARSSRWPAQSSQIPRRKNTTCLSGFLTASSTASSGE